MFRLTRMPVLTGHIPRTQLSRNRNPQRDLSIRQRINFPEIPLDLTVEKKLGKGVSKTVYSAIDIEAGIKYAVMSFDLVKKILGSTFLGSIFYRQSKQQDYGKQVLQSVRSENLMKLNLGKHPNLDTKVISTKVENNELLVLKPLADIPFNAYLKSGKTNFLETLKLLKGAVHGVQHLHERGFIHADIKPENFLLYHGRLIVSDFGHSLLTGTDSPQHGDEDYREPNVKSIDSKCDVYALLMSINDIFSSNNWKSGNEEQDIVIDEFRKYIKDAILMNRESRPGLDDLIVIFEKTIEEAEKFENYPTLKKSTRFRDSQFRESLLPAEDHSPILD